MGSQKWLCTGTVAAKGMSENTVLGQQALRPAGGKEVMYGMDIHHHARPDWGLQTHQHVLCLRTQEPGRSLCWPVPSRPMGPGAQCQEQNDPG